jgi:hypothetical protein
MLHPPPTKFLSSSWEGLVCTTRASAHMFNLSDSASIFGHSSSSSQCHSLIWERISDMHRYLFIPKTSAGTRLRMCDAHAFHDKPRPAKSMLAHCSVEVGSLVTVVSNYRLAFPGCMGPVAIVRTLPPQVPKRIIFLINSSYKKATPTLLNTSCLVLGTGTWQIETLGERLVVRCATTRSLYIRRLFPSLSIMAIVRPTCSVLRPPMGYLPVQKGKRKRRIYIAWAHLVMMKRHFVS